MTGVWRPIDLMYVRDAAVADQVPKMSELQGYGDFGNARTIYNLGHAAFEFIEARWGKEGVRQFVFSLRKSVIGGGENAFREAFDIDADEWDQQFDRYLKERFKPFRDKERPADYGRDLAPNPLKTRYSNVLSIEPSPSGDLIAAMSGNRRDRELDILLLSTKDGSVINNLTKGFDQDLGFESIPTPGMRFVAVPWMTWAPNDRLAYFVRTEKDRSLVIQNVVTRDIEVKVAMTTVDSPESPDFSPDGRTIAFAAAQGLVNDIYTINVDTKEIVNLTKDEFADYAPTWSPDGRSIVYLKRISGNEKLFRLDLASGKSTQLTFGTHDEGAAQFIDADTLVFTSTATDPAKPIDPDVAKNGTIHNVWTLNLKNGELEQYTDALGGNYSPVVLRDNTAAPRIAFISFYKGDYALHTLDRKEALAKAATADFGAPAPNIDFQAPMTHTLVAENKHKKGKFEKMFLDGRPPVNLGVTSGGDFFGGTQISFTDVLGDQQFNMFAASVSQYRTMSLSYMNLERRLQWAVQGYSQTTFFYGAYEGLFYDPQYAGLIDRDFAVATRTMRGGTIFGIYPFNRYRRVELYGGFMNYNEEYDDPALEFEATQYQMQQYGTTLFNSGNMMPLGVTFIQETTVFREFGPLAGSTMRVNYEGAPNLGDATLSRQTIDVDARKYFRLGGSGLFAMRARGYKSWGENPGFYYFGGNSEMRGYDYLSFIGQKAFHLNAELRFPLIDAMATPIGILGGIRGTFFANLGAAGFEEEPFRIYTKDTTIETPLLGSQQVLLPNGQIDLVPVYGPARPISGFRLLNSRASYGISLQTFALGFPVHFDWSWRTLFNRDWEDVVFAQEGIQDGVSGSSWLRKPKFTMWIGYDF